MTVLTKEINALTISFSRKCVILLTFKTIRRHRQANFVQQKYTMQQAWVKLLNNAMSGVILTPNV